MKKFEDFIKPDLRKIGKTVKCIKNIPKNFNKDSYYKVSGMYGDPQRAIEEFGINDYVPVECLSKAIILDNNGNKNEFIINREYYKGAIIFDKNFFEYFEIPKFENDREKYNL